MSRNVVSRPQSARLRVFYVDHTAQLSGGEIALGRLLESLSSVDPVVVLGADGPLVRHLEDLRIPVTIIPLSAAAKDFRRYSDVATVRSLAQLAGVLSCTLKLVLFMRRRRPNIIHTNSLKAAIFGGIAGRLLRIPVVWHLHDRISSDNMSEQSVRLIRGAAQWLASGIIFNSVSSQRAFGDFKKSWVVYPTVPIPKRTLRQLSRRSRGTAITMVGRLSPWKGQDIVLQAIAQVRERHPLQCELVGSALFGEDAYVEELHRLVARLRLEECVTFTGFVDDVQGVYERSDIVIHASRVAEPFGQVVAEAMAMGLPVVASNEGGPAELIQHGVNGLLFRPGDIAAAALCLEELIARPEYRVQLGDAARRRIEEIVAGSDGRIEEIYSELAK